VHNSLSPSASFQLSTFYVAVSIAFVGLGGVFAMAWKEDHPIKCLYIGATFPLVLSGWVHIVKP